MTLLSSLLEHPPVVVNFGLKKMEEQSYNKK
jgi:hypothetical protein